MPLIDWTPGEGRRGRPLRKVLGMGQRQGLIVLSAVAAVMVLIAAWSAVFGGGGGAAKNSGASQGSGGAGPGGAAGGGFGAAPTLPPDRAKAAGILQAAVQHYADEFAAGQKIVGHKGYGDMTAYSQAFADAKSPAAQFEKYRSAPNPEGDTSYVDALGKAAVALNGQRLAGLQKWQDDMVKVKADLGAWVGDAVSFQQGAAGQAALDGAAAKVGADLATAKADAAGI